MFLQKSMSKIIPNENLDMRQLEKVHVNDESRQSKKWT